MQQFKLHMNRVLLLAASAALLFGCEGCDSKSAAKPANFIAGLNRYYAEHPECLFTSAPTFPHETSDPAETKRFDALADMQLLEVQKSSAIHVSRYTVTTGGSRYAPRFCYGHRVVSAIDSFTPPATANGFKETTVTYRYALENVPVWAKSQQVQAAFPAVAKQLAGESTATATLAGNIAGWQVPD